MHKGVDVRRLRTLFSPSIGACYILRVVWLLLGATVHLWVSGRHRSFPGTLRYARVARATTWIVGIVHLLSVLVRKKSADDCMVPACDWGVNSSRLILMRTRSGQVGHWE
jgi:hypothetical protein